jgi:circadian clock protein KaiC
MERSQQTAVLLEKGEEHMNDDVRGATAARELPKAPTGIRGLDEITGGGFPRGRPTLVCGGAGCGKTLMAMEFLLHGAMEFSEPGVFITFEETAEELGQNVRSLGYDLPELEAAKLIAVDYVRVERSEIEEMDGYDLEGLFIRLDLAIRSVGAKRVVLDTIETLFGGFTNQSLLRSELRRLFRWLKDQGVTAVITGERGGGQLTRQGLEEYVSDCVIMLDHRVSEQVSTRRLRIVKYRGTAHGTNEYPFLIDEEGISVMPITSLELRHEASDERIPTGIPALDDMLTGGGYFRGSTVLVSGSAGTGKTSVAAHLARAACGRGEKCLYFAFEEARDQFLRNMRAIDLDFEPYIARGLFQFRASRPSHYGIEQHLIRIQRLVRDTKPAVVIIDPVSNFAAAGTRSDAGAMLTRLIDYLKLNGITALMTDLSIDKDLEGTEVNISSIVDSWLLLRNVEHDGERNRVLYVLKSRGMAHSNQLREFLITDQGIDLQDVYVGPEGVLTGSARAAHQIRDEAERLAKRQEVERRRHTMERKRQELEARIAALRADFEVEEENLKRELEEEEGRETVVRKRQADMANRRSGVSSALRRKIVN